MNFAVIAVPGKLIWESRYVSDENKAQTGLCAMGLIKYTMATLTDIGLCPGPVYNVILCNPTVQWWISSDSSGSKDVYFT